MSTVSIPIEIVRLILDFNTKDYIKEVNSKLTEEILDVIYKGLNELDGYEYIFDTDLRIDVTSKTVLRKVYINNLCSLHHKFSHRGLLVEFIFFCIAYSDKQFHELFKYFTNNCRSTFTDDKRLCTNIDREDIVSSIKYVFGSFREYDIPHHDYEDYQYTTCILKRLLINSVKDEYKRYQVMKGVLSTYMDEYHSLLEYTTHEIYINSWMSEEEQIEYDNENLFKMKNMVKFISNEMKNLDKEWFEECLVCAEEDIKVKFFI